MGSEQTRGVGACSGGGGETRLENEEGEEGEEGRED